MPLIKAELVSYMGSDTQVANAARVSFDKHVIELDERDEKLIGFLAKHDHFTPFTHCVITLRETVPIFVARQRFKHTVGFTYNEVSRRYVDTPPEFYTPAGWRARSPNKKQGSKDEEVSSAGAVDIEYTKFLKQAMRTYNYMLSVGVAPELARICLPQSMFTSYYVTGSLMAFARAYNLRAKDDAQKEIRDLAKQWDSVIGFLFPVSWTALTGSTTTTEVKGVETFNHGSGI